MIRNNISLRSLIITGLVCLVSLSSKSQSNLKSDNNISLLFIGDIMGHDEQIWSAENRETNTYNYDDVFRYIIPEISEADIAIANFEVTLAGPPYKGYPKFSSPDALAVACRNAGIDYLVTANNHSADGGKKGIENTINKLDSIGIPHTGTFFNGNNRNDLNPLIIKKDELTIALLNYTYGTNGITVPEPVIVNILDKNRISSDIEKAKGLNPGLIILFLHWGTEYDTIPSESQITLANYFFSQGVDLIIGSHPHVLQKMVWTKKSLTGKDALVVYSLGNFVSNQRKPKTDGGSMVRVVVSKDDDGEFRIINAGYLLTWVYTPIEKYRKKFFILPCSEFENKPEFFTNSADYNQMKKFILDSRALLDNQNINIGEIKYSGNDWPHDK
jgi:poly-gamma-glutamate synthesis protein (capsule biosynthesis protein)